MRLIWWDNRLLLDNVAWASSVIRIRRSGGLRQVHQDLVVRVGQPVLTLQLTAELVAQEQLHRDVGTPRALFVLRTTTGARSPDDGTGLRARVRVRPAPATG